MSQQPPQQPPQQPAAPQQLYTDNIPVGDPNELANALIGSTAVIKTGKGVVPLERVRRAVGDYWVPQEGQRTRSGRTVKPVMRYAEQEWEDDKTDDEDIEMETDEELAAELEEPNSEDEAFIADDDEDVEAEIPPDAEEEDETAMSVDEEDEDEEDETDEEEEEISLESDDDEDEDEYSYEYEEDN